MRSYGITPATDLMRVQQEANAAAERQYTRSSLGSMTFDTAVADAHEALVGLIADLAGTTERHSLRDIMFHKDRMRGLGILLIALAILGLVVDFVMTTT